MFNLNFPLRKNPIPLIYQKYTRPFELKSSICYTCVYKRINTYTQMEELMANTVRWNIAVSPDTDQALRIFLANQGGRKGDLSRFVEEAVRAHVFELTVEQAKAANQDINEDDLLAMVNEAVEWARGR